MPRTSWLGTWNLASCPERHMLHHLRFGLQWAHARSGPRVLHRSCEHSWVLRHWPSAIESLTVSSAPSGSLQQHSIAAIP